MDNAHQIRIYEREELLSKEWKGKSDIIPVNNQQHSFDTLKRQKIFEKSLFEIENELERYNNYREEWYRRAKEFDPGDAPLAVCCELVSYCNLNCSMCYTITEEYQSSVIGAQRILPWSIVKKIIDECAELKIPSMLFSWRGESTLYHSMDKNGNKKNLPDVLSYARKKGILEITCLTNGQILDPKMAEAIVEAEPSWISISIDGLEDNYNKIRTPFHKRVSDYNAFNTVVNNIKKIISLRNNRGKKRPQIRTNTIFPPIANDPYAYQKFMRDIGIGWITVNEILDFRSKEIPESSIIENWACQYPFQRLTVSANGSILPCTGAHNEEREMVIGRYTGSRKKEVKKGNSTIIIDNPERNLSESWHCSELKNIRNLHKENRRKEIEVCRYCRHGAIKHGVEWIPDDWDMDNMVWTECIWKK